MPSNPNKHAELCPVCNGKGKVMPVPDPDVTSVMTPIPCHGCKGRGWIMVDGYRDEAKPQ